jgi:homoprotocatechuate degradation regulator HpaR
MTKRNTRNPVATGDARKTANAPVARRAIPMRTFAHSLPMALLRAREAVMRRFRPGLRDHGVTEQQWRVLRALAHAGPLSVTELANATFLLPPSLSRILPELEARSLIRRRQADADLRRSVISLEAKGLRLIATHAPYSEAVYDGIEEHFGSVRLEELFALLRALEMSMEASDGAQRRQRGPARRARRSGTNAPP